ncbi:MAG: type III toxin-antitoxin system ToxN/AbiQ family toxin [Acutalibacteraceae bacterium]|nr:type III toxin-antitoxin system ToxN/AbiQ family toxin [Acutalibacteraceae bacterium]
MKKRLNFYTVDIKYVRNLAQKDDNVRSVSPQLQKNNRPLVGVLVMVNGRNYCAPLSSPKLKHENMKNSVDFLKIKDSNEANAKVIGVINLNNMIPVDQSVITPLNLHIKQSDTPEDRYYKGLLNDQLDWCNDNMDLIVKKAQKLYDTVTNPKESTSKLLLKRCCDFAKLEKVLDKYISKSQSTERHSPLSRGKIKATAQKISQKSKASPSKKKEHDL